MIRQRGGDCIPAPYPYPARVQAAKPPRRRSPERIAAVDTGEQWFTPEKQALYDLLRDVNAQLGGDDTAAQLRVYVA